MEPVKETIIEQPVVQEEPAEVKPVAIKITTDLETLERELENQKEKNKQKPAAKTRRPRKISDDEVKEEVKIEKPSVTPEADNKPYMQIYSAEELAELEKEADTHDEPFVEEEIDYDEYDEYYEDEE
ncbi:MAG: hypothetical protein EOM74_06145 [Methanomicrobia archaeon]|nr:hypothetical protein [Methanomicrobia archaeon]